jgi:hypothetical protein
METLFDRLQMNAKMSELDFDKVGNKSIKEMQYIQRTKWTLDLGMWTFFQMSSNQYDQEG